MNLPGHLAVAYVVGRGRLRRLAAVTVGSLVPDVIDKPLMLAGVTPYGRTVGHSLVFWGYAVVIWMAAVTLRLRRAELLGGVVAGGLAHLAADLVDDVVEGFQSTGYAFSAWAGWPVTNPDMASWRVDPILALRRGPEVTTVLEIATVLAVVALAARRRER